MNDVMYVFGGRDQQGHYLNDLAALRISDGQWHIFTVMGLLPSARAGHSLTAIHQQIILAGGAQNTTSPPNVDFGIMYKLDVERCKPRWESPSSTILCMNSSTITFSRVERREPTISNICTSSCSTFSKSTALIHTQTVRIVSNSVLSVLIYLCFLVIQASIKKNDRTQGLFRGPS